MYRGTNIKKIRVFCKQSDLTQTSSSQTNPRQTDPTEPELEDHIEIINISVYLITMINSINFSIWASLSTSSFIIFSEINEITSISCFHIEENSSLSEVYKSELINFPFFIAIS